MHLRCMPRALLAKKKKAACFDPRGSSSGLRVKTLHIFCEYDLIIRRKQCVGRDMLLSKQQNLVSLTAGIYIVLFIFHSQ